MSRFSACSLCTKSLSWIGAFESHSTHSMCRLCAYIATSPRSTKLRVYIGLRDEKIAKSVTEPSIDITTEFNSSHHYYFLFLSIANSNALRYNQMRYFQLQTHVCCRESKGVSHLKNVLITSLMELLSDEWWFRNEISTLTWSSWKLL